MHSLPCERHSEQLPPGLTAESGQQQKHVALSLRRLIDRRCSRFRAPLKLPFSSRYRSPVVAWLFTLASSHPTCKATTTLSPCGPERHRSCHYPLKKAAVHAWCVWVGERLIPVPSCPLRSAGRFVSSYSFTFTAFSVASSFCPAQNPSGHRLSSLLHSSYFATPACCTFISATTSPVFESRYLC